MSKGHVMTVGGAISPDELGQTLIHEHLYLDASTLLQAHKYPPAANPALTWETAAEARWNPGGFPDNYRLTDVGMVIRELVPFQEAGGRTIVETTPAGLGRNPEALLKISRETDLHIVMGGGYYIEPCHPRELASRTSEDIAKELIAEIQQGVGQSGVRPGIIGEIGTSNPITPAEVKVVRAAAWAQRETGLPLTIHIHPWGKEGTTVLSILEQEKVDPSRVILNHITTAIHDDSYQRNLLDRGVNLAYDLFGFDHSLIGLGRYPPSDVDVVQKVVELASTDFLGQLFVSQDIGVRTRLRAYAGWGYAHLLEHVVPLFKAAGLSGEEVQTLLVENPRRILTIDSM